MSKNVEIKTLSKKKKYSTINTILKDLVTLKLDEFEKKFKVLVT